MNRVLRAVLLAVLVLPAHASAAAVPRAQGSATDDARPVSAPIVFRPAGGSVLELAGMGPYRGTLEVTQSGSKLAVVNEVDLESYVRGLAEVPGSWPIEALKAQAVAARTYALWERNNGAWKRYGYDICATTTCQVYAGASKEDGERGQRWVDAVKATAGRVLLHEGEPILARYHASSGGTTLANVDVFPRNGDPPYLKSVHDPPDKASPLHEWEVRFTLEAMTRILRDGVNLAGDLRSIQRDDATRTVTIRTAGGELQMSGSRFRSVVSKWAPRLYPDLYPSKRFDGLRMPATMPSSRFVVRREGTDFILEGKGFGHGVGMSQWGAKGRADRGDTYEEILRAYYPGTRLANYGGEETLRVGLTRTADAAAVTGSDAFAVLTAAEPLADSTIGRWRITPSRGRAVMVKPPEGFDLPLVLSGVEGPGKLAVRDGVLDRPLQVEFVIPKAAKVHASLRVQGEELAAAEEVYEAGEGRIRIDLADPQGLPVSGTYDVQLTAFDGETTASSIAKVDIQRPEAGPSATVVGGLVLLAIGGAWVARRRIARPVRGGPEPVT